MISVEMVVGTCNEGKDSKFIERWRAFIHIDKKLIVPFGITIYRYGTAEGGPWIEERGESPNEAVNNLLVVLGKIFLHNFGAPKISHNR